MRDRPIQTESPAGEAQNILRRPIVELKAEVRSVDRVSGEAGPADRPEARHPAEGAPVPSGQPEPDSERRQRSDQPRRLEPTAPSSPDSAWTVTHPAPLAPRPGALATNATPAASLDQPASAQPANELDSQTTPHQTQAITIRLQATAGRPVDLRFVDTGGDVKVTVRTEDARLASAVADDLPALERGLRSRGWSSEFRIPNRSSEARPLEEIRISNHESAETSVRSVGPGLETFGQGHESERRTNWAEELEDRNVAAALRRLANQGGQL